jgi:3,4-dihydroxy 2-butanone 4-phosphate synthase/GTP cyclohydrolase II
MSVFSDMLGELDDRSGLLARAMEIIGSEGSGVVVIINRTGPGILSKVLTARSDPGDDMDELRDYGAGAQILTELGVHDMVLLSNSHHTLVALEGYGLSIVGERPIPCAETN